MKTIKVPQELYEKILCLVHAVIFKAAAATEEQTNREVNERMRAFHLCSKYLFVLFDFFGFFSPSHSLRVAIVVRTKSEKSQYLFTGR